VPEPELFVNVTAEPLIVVENWQVFVLVLMT
jgi:hypothetical protein